MNKNNLERTAGHLLSNNRDFNQNDQNDQIIISSNSAWRNFGQWRNMNGAIWDIMANRMTQSRCQNEYLPKWRNGAIGDIMAQFWASWRIE